jgi:hypothetical protein
MITPDSLINDNNSEKFANRKLYVRYMVSLRCKKIVKEELDKLDIFYNLNDYCAIEFSDDVTPKSLSTLKRNLRKKGLDLLNPEESKLIDGIITSIIEIIHNFDQLPKVTYSEIIHDKLGRENESILVLKIFFDVTGMSVVQFIVYQKIERAKELLLYYDMPIDEIANTLNYESLDKLIAQFKKYTGLTPFYFKELKSERNRIASSIKKASINREVSAQN